MRRLISTTIALLLLIPLGGCADQPPVAPAPVQEFWREFSLRNAAWLDPVPREMRLTLVVSEQKYVGDPHDPSYAWSECERIESWCAPGQNARIDSWTLTLDPPRPEPGFRFQNGVGGRLFIPRMPMGRNIDPPIWYAARTGASPAGALNLLTWCGPPAGAALDRSTPDVVILRADGLTEDWRWLQGFFIQGADYPLHAASLTSSSFPHRIDEFEINIDPQTLKPRRVTEISQRRQTVVEFPPDQWLDLDGMPVPCCINVSFQLNDDKTYKLEYRFQIKNGVWIIDSAEFISPAASLCRRMKLTDVAFDPIPPETFTYPTDVELPEHSHTVLADGERIIRFETPDGPVLESKLSLPSDAVEPPPVVMFLHGAGPATFDTPLDLPPMIALDLGLDYKITGYCDFWARELTKKGVAFFRTNKRGCAQTQYPPRLRTNRALFSKAVPSVLLADYAAALDELRRQPDVDASRIILVGESEGTVMAARLALQSPDGVIAVALRGYAQDNTRDTIVWQNTVGPWRNVALVFDSDGDDVITREEYDSGRESFRKYALGYKTYDQMDANGDGRLTPPDLKATNAERLKYVLRAVEEGDDDILWPCLANLTAAYCLEDWRRPPLHETLLKLDVPLAIYHGDYDGTLRVEGVHETAAAFKKAGKTNLTVKTYPRLNHDLGFGRLVREKVYPQPFADLLDFILLHAAVEAPDRLPE